MMPRKSGSVPEDAFAVRAVSERGDAVLLRGAAVAAVLVHVAFLFAPLPSRPIELPPEPRHAPLQVTRTRLVPPPLPEPPPDIRPTARRIPLPAPAPEPERLEPEPEPVSIPIAEFAIPLDPGPPSIDFVEPPPVPAVVPEGTPGLVPPVQRPGAAQPVYPPIAARAGIEGRVVLSAVIGEDGRVREIEIVAAPEPDVGFAEAAVAAVGTWEYEPGRLGGRGVAVRLDVVVQFRLR